MIIQTYYSLSLPPPIFLSFSLSLYSLSSEEVKNDESTEVSSVLST
jgi:hypothetical protein